MVMRRALSAILAIVWVLTAVVTIAGAVESIPETITASDVIEAGAIVVLMVGMTGLGVLIVVRANNRIGWLLCGGGLLLSYQYWAYIRQPGLMEQWLVAGVVFMASFLVVPTLILLFPNGRLPSRRWWPVAWLGIGGATAAMLSVLFAPTIYDTDDPTPFAGVLPDAVLTVLDTSTTILLVPFVVAVVVSPIVRYRRADSLQRLQFKMFGYGAAVALAGSLATNAIGLGGVDPVIPGALSMMALPVSITAAIMRYRLFDIDRLISRTVGYAVVVTILALIYVVGAVWLPTQLIGEQSPLFVAGATLAAASLFNPVRRRVIDRVDHRFNRSRYDAQHVISEFNERLRDQIDVDQITADSVSVITRTMQPASVVVWVRQ
jgi:hypothetical protein